jgi:hypothetical protein
MRKIYITNNGLQEILEGQDFLIRDDWVKCELDEDGGPHSNYKADGTPDIPKITEEKEKENIANKVEENKRYLSSTDFKMTIDYYNTLTEKEQDELTLARAEAREFIRNNEI